MTSVISRVRDLSCGFSCRYVPLFLVLFLFFSGCFSHRKQEEKTPAAAWMLLIPNAAYYWSDCLTATPHQACELPRARLSPPSLLFLVKTIYVRIYTSYSNNKVKHKP